MEIYFPCLLGLIDFHPFVIHPLEGMGMVQVNKAPTICIVPTFLIIATPCCSQGQINATFGVFKTTALIK